MHGSVSSYVFRSFEVNASEYIGNVEEFIITTLANSN